MTDTRHIMGLFALVCMCLGITTHGNGQDRYLGIKAGANLVDTKNLFVGAHFGFFSIKRYEKSALQIELLGSNHRIELDYPVYGSRTNSFWYINIPALYKRYIGRSNFSINGGLQVGVMVAATGVQLYYPTGAAPPVMGDIKFPNAVLGSAVFGFSWEGKSGISLDARYLLGLTDTNTASTSWNIRNRLFNVSIGYRITQRSRKI